ncbi:WD40 repeat domain-containing serine/threonine-protein kinase [Aureliella helgolandensis]|nr:protein kinase [Aureliella helgolandensis]
MNKPDPLNALAVAAIDSFGKRNRKRSGQKVKVEEQLEKAAEQPTADDVGSRRDASHCIPGPRQPSPPLPCRIGRFRVESIAGQGGFAIVYCAFDEVLCRNVALKVVKRKTIADLEKVSFQIREAQAVARLSHPNIVPLYEVVEDADQFCLVSEYCEGVTLADWLEEHPGPCAPQVAVEIVQQLAAAIAHAHSRGLVHRDVKPENILLVPVERRVSSLELVPRLTDFGLVRDLRTPVDEKHDGLLGTLDYMAPEQIMLGPENHGAAADIYTLGVLLYRMLVGRLPHEGLNALGIIRSTCSDGIVAPRSLLPQVSRDLNAVCLKCLQKDPEQRYESAQLLAADLENWQQDRPVAARPQAFSERCFHGIRRAPIQAGLVLLIFVLSFVTALALAGLNRQLEVNSHKLQQAFGKAQDREWDARRNERKANELLIESEKHQLQAVNAVYQMEIPRGFKALARNCPCDALAICRSLATYVGDTIPLGIDYRILHGLASQDWVNLHQSERSIEEVVRVPNRPWVVSAGEAGQVWIHNYLTGEAVAEITYEAGTSIYALACSADGTKLAVGRAWSPDALRENSINTVCIERLDDFSVDESLVVLEGFDTTVESLAFSPDGTQLAIGTRYEPIQIRSLLPDQNTVVRTELAGPGGLLRRNESLSFMAGGKRLLVNRVKGTMSICHPESGEELRVWEMPNRPARWALSPDERWLACDVEATDNVEVYHFDKGLRSAPKLRFILTGLAAGKNFLDFSPSGERLAVGQANGAIAVWNLPIQRKGRNRKPVELEPFYDVVLHHASVTSIAMLSEDEIVSGAKMGSCVINRIPVARTRLAAASDLPTQCAALTPDGDHVYLGAHDGRLMRVDVDTSETTEVLPAQGSPLVYLSVAPNGKWLGVAWENGKTALLDRERQELCFEQMAQGEIERRPNPVGILFSGDSRRMLVANAIDVIQSWDLSAWPGDSRAANSPAPEKSPFPIDTLLLEREAESMQFSADGQLLIYGGRAEELRSVQLNDSAESILMSGPQNATSLHWDHSRELCWVGYRDGRVRTFDRQGNCVLESPLMSRSSFHTVGEGSEHASVTALTLSADGKYLFTGDSNGRLLLWNAAELKLIAELSDGQQAGQVNALQLSQDGKTLMYHQLKPDDSLGHGLNLVRM